MSEKSPFPFPTWDLFVAEFKLRFVKENEQEHALAKLESRSYYMGSRDVFLYTDEFEDLVDLAGFSDPIMKVAKYRTGLDPAINFAIAESSDPPKLADYLEWRRRAYRQYESHLSARTYAPASSARGSGRAPSSVGRSSFAPGRLPVPSVRAPATAPAAPVRFAPTLPPPVPMDVDRTRTQGVSCRG